MRIEVWMSVGYGSRRIEVEVPDEDLEGLSEQQREEVFEEYAQGELHNYLEYGWKEIGE